MSTIDVVAVPTKTMVREWKTTVARMENDKICVHTAFGLRDFELTRFYLYEECPSETFGNLYNVLNVSPKAR